MSHVNKTIDLYNITGKGYEEFWHTKKRYRIVKGSRGSKKSCTTALYYIVNIMRYPDSNVLVVRRFFCLHRDSTFAQLKWAINRLGVAHLWDCKVSPLEIVYRPTGQKILFRGIDDPQSITSITVERGFLCWCWFEEFYQVNDEKDFNMVDMSIRGQLPGHLWKQITGTLNPWNDKHWIKKRFFDTPDDDAFTQTTNYLCNEFLDQADIKLFEKMRLANMRRYVVEGLGEWGVSEGLIYENWIEQEFDYNDILKRKSIVAGHGLDFGYTADPTAFVRFLVDTEMMELYIFDEHFGKGMLNNQIADMIINKGAAKDDIYADCAEPKSIEEIRRLGITRIKAATKGPDSIVNGIQVLQQYRIIVHPRCANMVGELGNYAWVNNRKTGQQLNKPIDDFNHGLDALRYGMQVIKTNEFYFGIV